MGTVTDMEQKKKTDHTVSMHGGATRTPGGAVTGSGMDRRVEKKKQPWKKIGIAAGAVGLVALIASVVMDASSGRSFKVNEGRIVVSEVSEGTFEDFIPIRGRVTPLKTVFLDAIEGGRVERVLVEDGAMLKKGDLIVELSNTTLQLEVTRNEALVTEQLNNMRSIELSLEQNRLDHKRNLVELDYQIKRLERQVQRERELIKTNAVSQMQLDQTEDELDYYQKRRAVTLESQATDARMQETQLKFLQDSGQQLEASLEFARKNLAALNVRAPVDGKLSGFNVEIGQSITRGGRLGQIDDPDNYKLTANIDEFYLGRVDLGQEALFERGREEYRMTIAKIYPQVTNGQFEVDFVFEGEQPDGIRRGQTLQAKLTLGDATKAKLVPNGAFYQDTGGNWVFVVAPDGSEAIKRNVRLGRRNNNYIEVIDGLDIGERVVTSPYTGFVEMDRLKLDGEN
ncbi:efflux RND transporter periplasmic adaptor subunit [Kordiimonas gwangyangensis]|uniref:efflux RND transporter periplasmic adaptor subunit n=1 Tax=Kordiimonas gwangyangensis TaxID=288022 RepID=UPI00037C35F1|nr:efflux RND transporter periplasmic adaptor subunit [Kordiimonas gwangyangensis]